MPNQADKLAEIDRAFYELAVKERDFERQRYDRLVDLIAAIGARHGFGWEPDCSPKSMLAKLSARITILERDAKPS